ncbi:MAG: transporter related protein [Firmicutes bacterium]|nr:transporter related protein [Bacillota bacterium]
MSVFRVGNLTKAYGTHTVFADVSFELRRGEKVGLIGANGCGKTTLLRCIMGREAADSGSVTLPAGETVGWVEQEGGFGGGTLYEELLAGFRDVLAHQAEMNRLEKAIARETEEEGLAGLMKSYAAAVQRFEHGGGYGYEAAIRRVAAGLGFSAEDLERPVADFSGGQKTRIGLARALVRQPDFLFLDEPTNHLDIGMVEWLEDFLREYAGGVLVISHDRYFLDQVAERILELENGTLTAYRGNYSRYLVQKEERVASQQEAYDKQQEYITKTEAYIDRFRAGIKSKQARGRQSQLDRLERLNAPAEKRQFTLELPMLTDSAERVAELDRVKAAYGPKVIFEELSLLLRRGQGVALVGPNGAGKTTLLKLLAGELAPTKGSVKLGSRVRLGYFAQEHEGLDPDNRMLDELMKEFGFGEEQARNYLGAMLFRGDEVYKLIGELSGGEKARLALLKLMLTGANFLLLDEPTNHLDIPGKEAVEEALGEYPGTFLTVSHDRYFLDRVADHVLELADGKLTVYVGNYSYYREKKQAAKAEAAKAEAEASRLAELAAARAKPAGGKSEPGLAVGAAAGDEADGVGGVAEEAARSQGSKAVKPRSRDRQEGERRMAALELEIREYEGLLSVLEKRLADPASHADPAASQALADEYAEIKAYLDARYEEWMEYCG